MKTKNDDWRILTAVLGAAYLAFGVLGIVAMAYRPEWLVVIYPTTDIMTDLILVLVGLVFLAGVKKWRKDSLEGQAFAMVGAFMGVFIAIVSALTLMAHAIEAYLLKSEEFLPWSPWQDLGPALFLLAPCLVLLWHLYRTLFATRAKAGTEGGAR